jgi:hypothetical protein
VVLVDPAATGATMDFDRERRRRALARVAARLRSEPDDVSGMLPFEEVVDALGRRSQNDLGVQDIPLDAVVGTVGRRPQGEFDRRFRPATQRVRGRWESVAAARRRGIILPPIDVYRVGDLYFVEDGHHRVSVARAFGDPTIEAHVREVRTAVDAAPTLLARQLPLKHHERVFHERVPLPPAARERVKLSDEWRYAALAQLIEARGFRQSQAAGRLLSRAEVARAWFDEMFVPIVEVLRREDIGGEGTDADRYLRFAILRYLLLHTNEWTDEVVERLIDEIRGTTPSDDTLVHQILDEMK